MANEITTITTINISKEEIEKAFTEENLKIFEKHLFEIHKQELAKTLKELGARCALCGGGFGEEFHNCPEPAPSDPFSQPITDIDPDLYI